MARSKVRSLASLIQTQSGGAPRVVEVGSFVGGFLAAGQDQGWGMVGVDPGKEVTTFCREQGLNVFCGTLIEASVPAGTVDAVAIWNTFDQLPNPDSTLAAARQMLHEQGILVLRIPNGSCFRRMVSWHKRLAEPLKRWLATALAWNNLLEFPYLYGYTLRTLDELLSRHGFARVAACPDAPMTLSNEDSTRWARWEEKVVKWCCRTAGHIEQAWDGSGSHVAPWLDIYYRATPTESNTTLAVGRESHTTRT